MLSRPYPGPFKKQTPGDPIGRLGGPRRGLPARWSASLRALRRKAVTRTDRKRRTSTAAPPYTSESSSRAIPATGIATQSGRLLSS